MGARTVTLNGAPVWRRVARRAIMAPGLRLLAPGWPDAGRRVVQGPPLTELLARAAARAGEIRLAVNAGAGEGLYTPLIRRAVPGANLLEFDMSPAPAGTGRNSTRFAASLTSIPLPSGSVQLAVCTEVLEHVQDDDRAARELRRILTDGGSLVLSVPTPPAVFDPAHVREGYTLMELSALLRRCGLVVVDARYCMHTFFKAVLRRWRPYRVPLGVILALAWLDRWVRVGTPMDLIVLARPDGALTPGRDEQPPARES
jgi:SAM-dependent methyltransferase